MQRDPFFIIELPEEVGGARGKGMNGFAGSLE
jgi:hypothetical protein